MAIQHINCLSPFSISMHIEDGIFPNILVMSSDISENILTDPGLGKESLSGWWNSNGFKLSETYLKTVPIDSEVFILFYLSRKFL
jgi:hypothetical protein